MALLFRKVPIKHSINCRKRTKTSQAKNKKQDYLVVRAVPEDYDPILRLMHKSYYTEEPTASSIEFKPTPLFDDLVLQTLTQGYTLTAKCKLNGDILGAAINESITRWDADTLEKLACQVSDKKSKILLNFNALIHKTGDLWKHYGVQQIFEISYLFTRSDQRKKGIAYKLAHDSRSLAADCGFSLVKMDATSHYSALLAERMKMKMVAEIPYCSYVGADQRPIFNPPDPHKSVKIYVDDEPQKHALLKQ